MAKKSKKNIFKTKNTKIDKKAAFIDNLKNAQFNSFLPIISLFLITIFCFIAYSNSFQVPFSFDDYHAIKRDISIRYMHNFWPPQGMRYMGDLSFALNYQTGKLEVFGFHVVNFAIHLINALLVFFTVRYLFKTPAIDKNEETIKASHYIAFFSGVIFAVHPIQTQAVTYIVQRYASLAALFYILSFLLYIIARLSLNSKNFKKGLTLLALSFLSALFAMKTKEISFTLPFIIILAEFVFFYEKGNIKKKLLYLSPMIIPLIIIPIQILNMDKPLEEILNDLSQATQETDAIDRHIYLFTQFKVIMTYIRLLFLPVNQNLDYAYPLANGFFDVKVLFSFIFLFVFFALGVYLLKKGLVTKKYHHLITGFGIMWFFIALSVESSIIPIRDVIFEHRLYLPFFGFVVAFAASAYYYGRKINIKTEHIILFTLIVSIIFTIATYRRNIIWQSNITLWNDVIEKSPRKARGYNSLGSAQIKGKEYEEAKRNIHIALKLRPKYALAYTNLGTIYDEQGIFDKAIENYAKALELRPTYPGALNNLGNAYYKTGKYNDAIEPLLQAIKEREGFAEAHYNLGTVYLELMMLEKALEQIEISIDLDPKNERAYNNLGNCLFKLNRREEALKAFQMSVTVDPKHFDAYLNLGTAYYAFKRYDEALKTFQHALTLKPDSYLGWYKITLIYNELGKNTEAIHSIKQALKIQPRSEQAQGILNKLITGRNNALKQNK